MKKALFASAALIAALTAGAQNLGSILGSLGGSKSGDILNTVSNVVYAFTGNTTAVSLPGTWTYTGAAVALGSENVLSNVAGAAASGTIESKVDGYLKNIGLTAGAATFTFNEDLSFSCTLRGVPLTGTWRTINDGKTVQLQFGKTLKYMNMTGTLKGTATGCEMLFEAKKFLSFMKTALAVVAKQSSTASTFSSLAENYNDMKIGFKLNRK